MTAALGKLDLASFEVNGASRRRCRLEAFHASHRRYIAELTSCARPLEDLAETFPALLFALVSGYGSPQARERACHLVCEGAPLRDAADALGLAFWLRKLPPQAFVARLPVFPGDAEFALRIASLIPREARLTAAWLTRVGHAYEASGTAYALWIARQPDLVTPPEDLFVHMAAWAWFSERSGVSGSRLLRRPWTPEMSFKRACDEVTIWRQRLRLMECLGPGIESPWLADGHVQGLDFVALRTVEDFIAESEELENCLDQYADQLSTGLTAVFSIRKRGRRIACVEIGPHAQEVTMPGIVQLRAVRNKRATPEIWQAAYAWLGSQRLYPLALRRITPKPVKRAEIRRRLWGPYLAFLEGADPGHTQSFRRLVLGRSGPRTGPRGRAAAAPEAGLAHLERVLETLCGEPAATPEPVTEAPRARTA